MTATTHYCPECKQPLSREVEPDTGLITLWCAFGPCTSIVTNLGGTGMTDAEAFKDLEKMWADEGKGMP